MVVALVLLTVLIFVFIDAFIRREDRKVKDREQEIHSPIFLTPDKALFHVDTSPDRLFHLSHTWVEPVESDMMYVGFDDFVSFVMPGAVRITNIPKLHTMLWQGDKIWDLQLNGRHIPQMAPVSGEIIDINPACNMDIPLPATEVEKSWIMKIRPTQFRQDRQNLATSDLAGTLNGSLRDEVTLLAHDGHLLNDGGEIEADFLTSLTDDEWKNFMQRYFIRV